MTIDVPFKFDTKLYKSRIISSSHRSCSVKNVSLKFFTIFTGNQALGPATLLKRDSSIGASYGFCDFFKNTLFTEHVRVAVSGCCTIEAFYPELNQIQILWGQLLLPTVSLKQFISTVVI